MSGRDGSTAENVEVLVAVYIDEAQRVVAGDLGDAVNASANRRELLAAAVGAGLEQLRFRRGCASRSRCVWCLVAPRSAAAQGGVAHAHGRL